MSAIQNGDFVTFKSGVTSEEVSAFWAGTGVRPRWRRAGRNVESWLTPIAGNYILIQTIPQSKLTINTGVQLHIAFLGNENGNVVDIPVRPRGSRCPPMTGPCMSPA